MWHFYILHLLLLRHGLPMLRSRLGRWPRLASGTQGRRKRFKINFMKTKPWKTGTAKTGHLTGFSSQVTCAWCGCVLGDWQYGDQVEDGSAPHECDQHCIHVMLINFLLDFCCQSMVMLYEIKYFKELSFASRLCCPVSVYACF